MKRSSKHIPPEWIRKFLGIFLDPSLLEASLGDLEEKFQLNVKRGMPRRKAGICYVTEALGFIKMASWQQTGSIQTKINMIRHTIFFLARLIRKNQAYYILSLFGLTISLSSFLLITMFV